MCATCGCSSAAVVRLFPASHEHEIGEHDSHEHPGHEHLGHEHERTVQLQQKVLAKNDRLAEANRDWLRQRGILAINLMSSPGAGKTTLLERTARDLGGQMAISVIEGDQPAARAATSTPRWWPKGCACSTRPAVRWL